MPSALVLTFLLCGQECDAALSVNDRIWHVPLANRNGIDEVQFTYSEMIRFFKQHPGFWKSWQPELD